MRSLLINVLCRSITISAFLFFMNNLGGNLPLLIQPVAGTCYVLFFHTVPKIRYIYAQKWNRAASFPIPTFMYLWAIYIFPDTWMWKLGDRRLQFCFGNNEAAQFHFWKYINQNHTFTLDSHRPFICSASLKANSDPDVWSKQRGLNSKRDPCCVCPLCSKSYIIAPKVPSDIAKMGKLRWQKLEI